MAFQSTLGWGNDGIYLVGDCPRRKTAVYKYIYGKALLHSTAEVVFSAVGSSLAFLEGKQGEAI